MKKQPKNLENFERTTPNYNERLRKVLKGGNTILFIPENYSVSDADPIIYSRKLHEKYALVKDADLIEAGVAVRVDKSKALGYYTKCSEIMSLRYGEERIIATEVSDKPEIEAKVSLGKYGFEVTNIGATMVNTLSK